MVDDDGREENNPGNIPVTPAPGRSQANLASRAPGPERGIAAETGSATPQAAAKPPPDDSVFKERRRISDAAPTVADFQESSAWADPGVREAAPASGGRRNIRATAARCLLVLFPILTGVTRQKGLDHAIVAPPRPAAVSGGPAVTAAEPVSGLPNDPGAALTTALDDLDSAVQGVPQHSPEEILRMVSRPGRDCRLIWKGHFPSIVFGTTPIRPNSLAENLEGCAQAVKQMSR